jgi:hypothetical protein
MKFPTTAILFCLTLLFSCEQVKTDIEKVKKDDNSIESVFSNNSVTVDSIEFYLTDSTSKKFWFQKFNLVFYRDSTYKFDFNHWGGYQANENGPYYMKGDSLILISPLGKTERILIFKNDLSQSDFYTTTDFFQSKYLKVLKLNIDVNANNLSTLDTKSNREQSSNENGRSYRKAKETDLNPLALNICSTEDLEFMDLYSTMDSISSGKYESVIIVDSLKAKGFDIVKTGRGNWAKGPRIISITMSNKKCECVVDKLYYSTYQEGKYKVTERIKCEKTNK